MLKKKKDRKEQKIRADLNFEVFDDKDNKIGYFEDGEWVESKKMENEK
jgi:hypothetical protein